MSKRIQRPIFSEEVYTAPIGHHWDGTLSNLHKYFLIVERRNEQFTGLGQEAQMLQRALEVGDIAIDL